MNFKWFCLEMEIQRNSFCCTKFQDEYLGASNTCSQCGTSMSTLISLWRGTTLIQYFLYSNWKYGHHTLNHFILSLGAYFSVYAFSKQQHAMQCGMRKPIKLKVRYYTDSMVDTNESLNVFPGGK